MLSANPRRTLAALRAVGPCSNRELARALRMPAADCYLAVAYLRRKGLVTRLGEELYAVTAEGRRELLVGNAPTRIEPDLFTETRT